MKCGVRVALGVVGGYFLGRTKKMKLAMMLGGMAAGRRAGGPGQLLAQGTKVLGQSPELARLTEEIRGRLLDAGKAAAVAVATRQVENLTERVLSRAGTLADTGGKAVSDVAGTAGGTVSDVGESVRGLGRQSRNDVESDEENEEASEEEYDESSDSAAEASAEESGEESGEDAGEESGELEEPVDEPREELTEVDEDEQAPPARRRSGIRGRQERGNG